MFIGLGLLVAKVRASFNKFFQFLLSNPPTTYLGGFEFLAVNISKDGLVVET
jgi:hypothetical protein